MNIKTAVMSVRQRVPISEIMTTDLIVLNLNDGLDKAEHLFKLHSIRHIPVIDGDKIVGMLSLTDLLRISFADGAYEDEENIETIVYNMFTISQVMAKNIESVSPNATIKEVAEELAAKEYHALPVVEDEKLVGIVTTTDLIKYLIKQY